MPLLFLCPVCRPWNSRFGQSKPRCRPSMPMRSRFRQKLWMKSCGREAIEAKARPRHTSGRSSPPCFPCGTSSCRKRAGCAHRSRQGRTPFWLSGATCRVHLLPGASAECERVGFHLPCRGWQSRQSSLWKQTAPDKTLLSWTNTAPSAPPPGTPARCAGQAGSSTGSPQLLRRSRGSPGLHIRAAHRMAA